MFYAKQYSALFGIMCLFGLTTAIPYAQLALLLLLLMCIILEQVQTNKISDFHSLFTLLVVGIHPFIHWATMHNEGFYQTNIAWDLALHTCTALLSLSLAWSTHHHQSVCYYLLLVLVGCVLATLDAIFFQQPDAHGEHTFPLITLFPTLSVINFSVLNIFGEKSLFNERFLLEALYTLVLFVVLWQKYLPVSYFLRMQYAETYFVCAMCVACFDAKSKNTQ